MLALLGTLASDISCARSIAEDEKLLSRKVWKWAEEGTYQEVVAELLGVGELLLEPVALLLGLIEDTDCALLTDGHARVEQG